ncbi:hypothetical protein JNB_14978 [Janibacter sp. HTCC2649]|nr:hypothetical protein JNB_14978 [Janibacter sp. HTCC2649]
MSYVTELDVDRSKGGVDAFIALSLRCYWFESECSMSL